MYLITTKQENTAHYVDYVANFFDASAISEFWIKATITRCNSIEEGMHIAQMESIT